MTTTKQLCLIFFILALAGLALALDKPIALVLPGVVLEPASQRPIGSWIQHPLVTRCVDIHSGVEHLRRCM